MDVDEIEHLNLAQSVLRRPKLYTANGTLSEVLALFNGYDLAARAVGEKNTDLSICHVLNRVEDSFPFRWLKSPEEKISAMINALGTEADVLATLEAMAAEFKSNGHRAGQK